MMRYRELGKIKRREAFRSINVEIGGAEAKQIATAERSKSGRRYINPRAFRGLVEAARIAKAAEVAPPRVVTPDEVGIEAHGLGYALLVDDEPAGYVERQGSRWYLKGTIESFTTRKAAIESFASKF